MDFTVTRLGECRVPSPMADNRFVADDARIIYLTALGDLMPYFRACQEPPTMELAGPRERIFFDPANLKCGIVTCGGLCPGVNDVIRAVTMSLFYHYGVREVYGFRYGFEGLSRQRQEPMRLTPRLVKYIHEMGGTLLGTSRGPQDIGEMTDTLEQFGIGILFAIGGDGTLRGASALVREIDRRELKTAVIAIPKTIDNDISYIQQSFGFETAASEARRAVYAAHSEAVGARDGIGLVKLMGRESGFIAAYSVLANPLVNFCLVPEVPFRAEKLLKALEKRLEERGHAVIVAAEGAGQDLLEKTGERDLSGNPKLGDIGLFLRERILAHFKLLGREVMLKYIDPSYIIRSLPANAHDSAFCLLLGQNAVHAGMAGRTDMVVGLWNHQFTHLPIRMAVSERKRLDPNGWIWNSVLAATGQPADLV
ncbi:MAG: ATP-dependent 6-phosphofructokinase [Deltaproteobacteria bacterium]|nr:ATP-dependent 6-phosphofructokinase [Deltaproteobacteria bacterium]